MMSILKKTPKVPVKQHRDSEQGYLIVVAVVVATILIGLSTALASLVSSKYAKTAENNTVVNALYAAEAGVTDTVAQLNTYGVFSGYPDSSRKVLYSSAERGRAEYSTTVTDNGNNTITVTSTGYLHNRHTAATNSQESAKRTVRAVLQRNEVPAPGNILAGAGGLGVKGAVYSYYGWSGSPATHGVIFSRGKISLNNSTAVLGSAEKAMEIKAGNVGCGNATNWPQPCGPGSQPITLSNNARIYGTVCANDQTNASNILPGSVGEGLIAGCTVPASQRMQFHKQSFTSKMTTTWTGSAASCNVGFGSSVTRTVEANTKIVGDVTIDGGTAYGGDCKIYVKGDVYITGNLRIVGNSKVYVADEAGTRKPRIIVNGKVTIDLSQQNTGIFKNSQGTPMGIMGFWATNYANSSSCSRSDTCTTLSSAEAYSSAYRDLSTSGGVFSGTWQSTANDAVVIKSAEGGSLAGLVAYAYFGVLFYEAAAGVTVAGIGGEGLAVSLCGMNAFNCYIDTQPRGLLVMDDLPFSGVLMLASYKLLDYQQVY